MTHSKLLLCLTVFLSFHSPLEASARSYIVKLVNTTQDNIKSSKSSMTQDIAGVKHLSPRAGLIKVDAGYFADKKSLAANLHIPLERIAYIEPDYKRSLLAVPNDTEYVKQIGLKSLGFEATWGELAERSEVIVGVIDTGIDISHPDLKNRIWKNSHEDWGEVGAGNNHLDDDSDGFVDNYWGVNIIAGQGNAIDDNGHGTSVAGIIAAECNNAIGICGVSQKATILPIKVLDSLGDGSTSDFITAIDSLIDFKKRTGKPVVINASLGGYDYSQAEHDVLELAGQEGILVIVPAGNSHLDNDSSPLYPASYDLPNIISVASVNEARQLSYFSNWGETTVDLAAPGEQVYSTKNGGGYRTISGTSFSAPYVAGMVAILQSVNPVMGLKTKDYILNGVTKQAGLTDQLVSGGILTLPGAAAQSALDQVEWSLQLNKGMNLVSFPVSPLYCGDTVIRGGRENVESVWKFVGGVWNSYIPAQPGFSDLRCFGSGEGYWIDAMEAGTITIAGFTLGEWPVLKPGWNLLGFPVAVSMTIADVLAQRYSGIQVESIWGYVDGQWRSYFPENVGMSDLIEVEGNRGYWVKTK